MSEYGTIVNFEDNPMKDEFKKMMINYFEDPIMTKTNHNFQNRSIYMVNIKSLLLSEKRYLIINTSIDDNEIGYKCRLSDLDFQIIQTKEIHGFKDVHLDKHEYSIRDNSKQQHYNSEIHVVNRNEKFTKYKSDLFEIDIILLHKLNIKYEYPDYATILTAIEKYSTILII